MAGGFGDQVLVFRMAGDVGGHKRTDGHDAKAPLTGAVQDGFGSAFQFGEIRSVIQANLGNYLLAIVIAIVAMAVAQIVGVIACGVGALFTIFWAYLVYAFLMGNVWLEAQAEPV